MSCGLCPDQSKSQWVPYPQTTHLFCNIFFAAISFSKQKKHHHKNQLKEKQNTNPSCSLPQDHSLKVPLKTPWGLQNSHVFPRIGIPNHPNSPSSRRGARNSFPPSFLAAIVPVELQQLLGPKGVRNLNDRTENERFPKEIRLDVFFSISAWSLKLWLGKTLWGWEVGTWSHQIHTHKACYCYCFNTPGWIRMIFSSNFCIKAT